MSASSQRIAIVTGGARGIGAAVVRRLAAQGVATVVHYRSRETEVRALIAELTGAGATAVAVRGDLRERSDVLGLFDAARELGGLNILVNNAGWSEFSPLGEITDIQVGDAFAVNFRAPLWTIQLAKEMMKPGGRIINISTLGTSSPSPGQSLYAASKAALEQLTLQGAVELAPAGITINSVCPGSTATELFLSAVPAQLQEELKRRPLFGRLGRPCDIAGVVAFLASEDAGWITGQQIVVSGGQR